MSFFTKLSASLNQQQETEPVQGTLSGPRIGMLWLAANLVVTTLLTGTLFLPDISYGTALLMILIGTLLGAVVLTLVGNIGTHTGLPTMALTRGAFGIRGSWVPLAANVVILMGWSWVQAMLAGITLDYVVSQLTGFSSPILFSVLCQTLVVILAIFGHTGISKAEPWFAVLMLVIIGWIFWTVFQNFSFAELNSISAPEEPKNTPVTVLDIVIATAVSWTVLSADFNRLAKNSKAGILGSGIGYTLSTVISMTLGATALGYVILSGGEAIPFDPTVLVAAFGMPLAIVIFVSVMATNSMVVYGMTLSVLNAKVGSRLRFLPTALTLGAISILGATWMALLQEFQTFLTVIGAFFVPVFAIMVIDYYLLHRQNYTKDLLLPQGGRYWYRQGVNWIAVGIWVFGAVVSYLLTYVWPSPVGATIPVFVLTGISYYVLMRGRTQTREGGSAETAPHGKLND